MLPSVLYWMVGVVPVSSVAVTETVGAETYQPFWPSGAPGVTAVVTTGGWSGVVITTVACAVAVKP